MNSTFQLTSAKERLPEEGTLILFFTEDQNNPGELEGVLNNPSWKIGYRFDTKWISNGKAYTNVFSWTYLPKPVIRNSPEDPRSYDRKLVRDLRSMARVHAKEGCLYHVAEVLALAADRIEQLTYEKRGSDNVQSN